MTDSTTKYRYQTTRRQNRSCDYCRRYKRACDAALSQWTGCSNCLRLGKTCTIGGLNPLKASTKTDTPLKGKAPVLETTTKPATGTPIHRRRRRDTDEEAAPPYIYGSNNEKVYPAPPLNSYFNRVNVIDGLNYQPATGHNLVEFYPNAPVPNIVNPTMWAPTQEAILPVHLDENYTDGERSNSLDGAESLYSMLSTGFGHGAPSLYPQNSDPSDDTNVHETRASTQSAPRLALSAHFLAEETNKALITTSLKRIYSDTLENALLCWVTEQSCPYNNEGIFTRQRQVHLFPQSGQVSKTGMIRRIQRLDRPSCVLNERPLTTKERQLASHALHATIMAFASQWSQLSGAGVPNLFGGDREGIGQQHFQEFEKLINASLFDFAETKLASFDRSLQVTLWNEAYQALQKAIHIDSFQVTFAQVIFGFTQRPLSQEDFQRVKNYGHDTNDYFQTNTPETPGFNPGVMWSDDEGSEPSVSARNETTTEFAETLELLDLDKDPLHLRDSLMRLSARRVKLSQSRARLDAASATSDSASPEVEEFLADRMTFNQLFWLVMMCDTLSSAINNRLPIVSDEDSVILNENDKKAVRKGTSGDLQTRAVHIARESSSVQDSAHDTESEMEANPWGMYFLERNHEPITGGFLQWPFSKTTASTLLSEAAPVKALLYRKVKQLQNAHFRRSSPAKLELLIVDALKVYEHWTRNFGNLVTTCIQHHDELHPQIQSWYSVLTSHWNLACYLLSDLIEELDRTGKTDKRHSAIRKSCGLLFHIRRQSAFEMGDLGRVGRVREDCSFSQMNDFHPTVNDGALLTEPWTEIMIRSFARVSTQFLTWLGEINSQSFTDNHPSWDRWIPGDQERLYSNLGYCVEALLDLGRKSDLAFLLAISLKRRMVPFARH
ncbi:hypothetical protein B0A52_06160 [Exophiala mesophila]|uniref:Zn(2)-C6 fungal-type domain-containing protein n=1 Tax=Exophiala mesophila TaxID=212818 RepID=A0A438N5H8_EXOME|nr:hypothetical protein B0A52_06160 [Exophiala mesophila]